MAYANFLNIVRRDRESGLVHARLALELDPLSLNTNFGFGWWYLFAGEPEQAIEQARKTLELYPDALHAHSILGWAYVARSAHADAVAVLAELSSKRTHEHVPELVLATVHAGLGDLDRAFESLEKCYAERDVRLFWLPVDRRFDPLRCDPRYDDLVRRMGLGP